MIGELVAKLIAAGTPADLAAVAVAEAFAAGVSSIRPQTSRDEGATSRREKDRIRQQTRRDNLRTSRDNPQKSADVTGNPQTSTDSRDSLSKDSIEVIEKEEERKKERERGPSRDVRGQRLPENWEPNPADRSVAISALGAKAADELRKFCDHWKQQPGGKGLSLDWDAAWRIWVQRAIDYNASKTNAAAIEAFDPDLAWHQACKSWIGFGKWPAGLLPDPQSPACKCPREILGKYGISVAKREAVA